MVAANPPPILRKPKELQENPSVRAYLDSLERIVYQLWLRTGAGDDLVDGALTSDVYEAAIQSLDLEDAIEDYDHTFVPDLDLQAMIDEIDFSNRLEADKEKLEIIDVIADFTTTSSQICICNNTTPITLTLNDSPDDGEELIIKRLGSSVVVSGAIDGATSKTIASKYDAPHLVYTVAAGEWSII